VKNFAWLQDLAASDPSFLFAAKFFQKNRQIWLRSQLKKTLLVGASVAASRRIFTALCKGPLTNNMQKASTHLRFVTSAESVKLAKIADVASAAVMTIAGLIANAASTRGPTDRPWPNAKAPNRA
jgi:hypothetical protein